MQQIHLLFCLTTLCNLFPYAVRGDNDSLPVNILPHILSCVFSFCSVTLSTSSFDACRHQRKKTLFTHLPLYYNTIRTFSYIMRIECTTTISIVFFFFNQRYNIARNRHDNNNWSRLRFLIFISSTSLHDRFWELNKYLFHILI